MDGIRIAISGPKSALASAAQRRPDRDRHGRLRGLGKVEGERFRDADPEVAYHIRRAPHLDDKAFDHAARRGALTFDERVIDLPIGRPGATA